MSASNYDIYYDRDCLRLLAHGPFQRRRRGGWRFGTRVISDRIIARLTASGAARIEGDFVVATKQPAQTCPPKPAQIPVRSEPAQICAGGCAGEGWICAGAR